MRAARSRSSERPSPCFALARAFAGYQAQAQPQHPDPVASSVASYSMRALAGGQRHSGRCRPGQADAASSAQLQRGGKQAEAVAFRVGAPPLAQVPRTPHLARPPGRKPLRRRAACSGACGAGGTGMLPLNYAAIVNYLVAHGYTHMGAVGAFAGNIYQESQGNPESVGSGGGGLIGCTAAAVRLGDRQRGGRPADAARGAAHVQPGLGAVHPDAERRHEPDRRGVYLHDVLRAGQVSRRPPTVRAPRSRWPRPAGSPSPAPTAAGIPGVAVTAGYCQRPHERDRQASLPCL